MGLIVLDSYTLVNLLCFWINIKLVHKINFCFNVTFNSFSAKFRQLLSYCSHIYIILIHSSCYGHSFLKQKKWARSSKMRSARPCIWKWRAVWLQVRIKWELPWASNSTFTVEKGAMHYCSPGGNTISQNTETENPFIFYFLLCFIEIELHHFLSYPPSIPLLCFLKQFPFSPPVDCLCSFYYYCYIHMHECTCMYKYIQTHLLSLLLFICKRFHNWPVCIRQTIRGIILGKANSPSSNS